MTLRSKRNINSLIITNSSVHEHFCWLKWFHPTQNFNNSLTLRYLNQHSTSSHFRISPQSPHRTSSRKSWGGAITSGSRGAHLVRAPPNGRGPMVFKPQTLIFSHFFSFILSLILIEILSMIIPPQRLYWWSSSPG